MKKESQRSQGSPAHMVALHKEETHSNEYTRKKRKYMRLARTLKQLRRSEMRTTAVVVSSMGVIYNQSLKDLQKVLEYTDRKMKKPGR
jgi:hypothetical protein